MRIAGDSPDATAFRTACFGKSCRTVHADVTSAPWRHPVRQLGGLAMCRYALATSVAIMDWDSRYWLPGGVRRLLAWLAAASARMTRLALANG